jgi:hypothetical protein
VRRSIYLAVIISIAISLSNLTAKELPLCFDFSKKGKVFFLATDIESDKLSVNDFKQKLCAGKTCLEEFVRGKTLLSNYQRKVKCTGEFKLSGKGERREILQIHVGLFDPDLKSLILQLDSNFGKAKIEKCIYPSVDQRVLKVKTWMIKGRSHQYSLVIDECNTYAPIILKRIKD